LLSCAFKLRNPRHRKYSIQQLPGDYSVVLPKEPFVWGVSHIIPRPVPVHIPRPPYIKGDRPIPDDPMNGDPYEGDGRIVLGSPEERSLRNAALLAKDALNYASTLAKVGVTTETIDTALHEWITAHGAYPSPLLYSGFPKSCCTSVNNIICHGVPDDRPLEDGDIVNIDITVYVDGHHGDTSRTFLVGDVDEPGRRLVDITNNVLDLAIQYCGPGKPFKGIGKVIHDHTRRSGNYCVSQRFTGHGIGSAFHRPPWILHHLNDEPGVMLPGHCFTIEPVIVEGLDPTDWTFPDGWAASTQNCSRGAQAEQMVLITEDGYDVLTA